MPPRSPDNRLFIGAFLLALVVVFAGSRLRRQPRVVNTHDPDVNHVEAFELQPGEVGVVVRVRHRGQAVPGATVWADLDADEVETDEHCRHALADQSGLVRVPARKDGLGRTHLFARDADGRVGSATLSHEHLLAAPDVVLLDVAARPGRLVTTLGLPIPAAGLRAETFSSRWHPESSASFIDIPNPVQDDYRTNTDAGGRFSISGVPVGHDCRIAFRTTGYGEGRLELPAGSAGEFRLAPAGGVRVRVSGAGSAADLRGLQCRLVAKAAGQPGEPFVDGAQTRRHDGSNAFLFPNVVPGKYSVRIEGTALHSALPAKTVSVTVDPGQTAEVTVPLKQAGRLLGRVVDRASGKGIGGVRLDLLVAPSGDFDLGYRGRVTTDGVGRFGGYVPAGVPVTVVPNRCPPAYTSPQGLRAPLFADARAVTAPAGETRTLAEIKLDRRGTISGTVVAAGKPVAGAVVEVRWDGARQQAPATVTTDASGQFRVRGAPPDQPAALRVRADGMVNATIAFAANELAGPVTIPVSAGNAFRVRGQVADSRGRPMQRARVVVVATILPPKPSLPGPEAVPEAVPGLGVFVSYPPAEVEAVFTDTAGRFESGALWPGCSYTLTVSADGLVTRELPQVEGRPGQTHEIRAVLRSTAGVVAGTVVGMNGQPVAGATVVNSGDAPRRLTATTDEAGRFSLSGLYDGPAVVVAHKAGHRWAYAVAQPGGPAPQIVLRRLTEPPAAIAPPTAGSRRAEAALVRRLTAIVAKERASRPKPPAAADPWADARKDLDRFLAKQVKQSGMGTSARLAALARVLAKEDRSKALRALRAAAEAAQCLTLRAEQMAFRTLSGDFTAVVRVTELVRVAETAADLGARDEARAWLIEAEAMAGRLPPAQRGQPLGALAAAWVPLDLPRAEQFLVTGFDAFNMDMAVSGVLNRLIESDPEKAAVWLDRFKMTDGLAPVYRSRVAVRLAKRDLGRAIHLAEGINREAYRGATLARLATAAHARDRQLAHNLVEKAVVAVTGSQPEEGAAGQRMGAAIYLLWQAKQVEYPDLASLVAVTLATRPPVPAHAHQAETWRAQTVRLAAGVGGVDAAAGRALLPPDLARAPTAADEEESSFERLTALALADPETALRWCNRGAPNPDTAADVLAVLERPSLVVDRLSLLEELGWLRKEPEGLGIRD